jgi:hypothetical protein
MALVKWLRVDYDNDASHGHNFISIEKFLRSEAPNLFVCSFR